MEGSMWTGRVGDTVMATLYLKERVTYFIKIGIYQQIKHGKDAFLLLITDGINFVLQSKEACDVVNQAEDPYQAAQLLTEQVRNNIALICTVTFIWE